MTPPYTVSNDTITVILDGESFTIRRGAKNWDAARKAVLEENWDALGSLMSPGHAVKKWLGGGWTFVDHFLCYKGERIDERLNERLLKMVDAGESPNAWMSFWGLLQQNPSYRSVNQLYAFLTHEGIPIDSDGYILAYKSVTRDYLDHYSETFDNTPGQIHEMPRNKISDDPMVACHQGFHVGALKYAQSFGSADKRIIICKVHPADVVCVPHDSSAMKVRVCKYQVLGNYSGAPLPDTTFKEDPEYDPNLDVEEPEEPEDEEPEDDENDGFDGMPEREDVSEEELADADDEIADITEEPKKPKLKLDKHWAPFAKMSRAELAEYPLDRLRKFASKGLKIVGASKLPGGKEALLERIMEVLKP